VKRIVATAIVVALCSPVHAAPKGAAAKAAFERGVAAYQKGSFDTASEQLATSFGLEADPDTLYAWAQAERQRGKCDKAIELFEKLLAYELPEANAKVVREKLAECKAMIGGQSAQPVEPAPVKPAEPKPVEPAVEPAPEPAGPRSEPTPTSPERRAWWKDPVGGVLVGAGVVGLGVGSYFLLSARSADRDAEAATSYVDFEEHSQLAESRGRTGMITTLAGAALVGAGVVWYVTREPERSTVSAWLSSEGGGVVARARF